MFRLAQKENLIIPAHIDYLASLRDFITQIGKKYHFSHKFVNTFKLAVDEAATNIIKHAYSESEGYITIQAVVKRNSLTLKILDQGAYFDPKWAQEPNLKESVNSDEKMGLGIFMMRKLMDQVDYKKSASGNELTLSKKDQFKKGRLRLFNFSDLPTALKIRYLIHALIFVTVLNGSGYYYFYKIASTEVKANFIQAGEKISKQVTQQLSAITPGILNGPDGLSYLKAIILPIHDENLGRIYSLSLEDSLGFIAWSTIPTELNSSFQRPELNTKYEENIFNYSIGRENEVYEFESELIFETGKTFYKKLHVLISNNYLVHEIRKKRITYLKYALLSLGLCFIIIAFISYFVSHPIHKLTKWVRAAKTGNLLDEMDIDASTEIGEIAQAFSDITEKFNQSQKHLADREQYEKEINLAKDIQRSLLPREIPAIETLEISTYYEPAKTVGGDFYDFIEVDQDHIGIAIADVSGKGVPGSLMMTIIRTALRTEARGSNDAAEVLIRVNDFVVNEMQSGMFATIFYIIINTKTLVANFASAGHNPLILHSRSKKCTFNLNPNGFPVGIKLPIKDYFAQNIKSETIQLAQDELVLLYTDGITEAMNPAKQLYGEERLVNIISKSANLTVKKFTEKLKNSIYSFTEDGALHDDITFIALKPKKKTTDDIDYDSSLSVEVNFLSIDDSNKIIDIILNDPNWGAEEISQMLSTKQYGKLKLEPERILSELSRRQLHTVALRLKYVESKKKTRFSTAKPNNADIISILEEPPKNLQKQKNEKPGEANISVNPPSADKTGKPDYCDPVSGEEDSGTILKDIIEVLQPHTSSTVEGVEAEVTPTETSELTTPLEVTLDANSIEPEQVKELTESAELSAISEKQSDSKEAEETTKTESVSEPEKATEAETTVAEIVDSPETIEDPENTELPDKQVESAEPTEIENDHAIEFDISDNVDISDLLVDSIFEKFLNETLGEHTLQPNVEETSDEEEEETPSAEIKESETAIAVEVKPESPDSDIKKTSEKELATGDEAPEAEQPEAVRPAPESENETKAVKGSKKIKGTKPASKQKQVKPKRKKKTKATQVKLKPFVAPTEKNQNPLEYEFVLGNATELIGFEINEEREFEDFYDLSSELDVEFKRELELEEYELVLDIRPDDDDDFEEKAAKDEIEATALLSEEPNIEKIDETESIESVTDGKIETTTLTLNIDEVTTSETENEFVDTVLDDAINFDEIDKTSSDNAASASPEQTEDLTESDAQTAGAPPPASIETEDFGLELFADLNVFDDDAFEQDLAEFDQPTLEEKTSKEPRVQKPVPFSGLQTNELEDVYNVKPRKSRRKKAPTSATEATEISAQQEPKTEALRVKTKIIEEPPIEGSESSSPRDEQASPEVAATPNVEEDTILQDNLTESEGAAILQEDEEASVISKEMPLQQPAKQFSDTPFISLKTNEIEDKYAKDIGLKQSRPQEAPIESKLQATETIEVEIKTATAELTQETKPEIAHEPEAEEPTAEPVAKTSEPEVIEPEPAQVISPNLTQAEDDKDELKEHLLTGVTYYKNKEYEDAIIFLKKVIKLDPNMKEAFAMLGNAYYRNGMLYEAIMAYEQLEPHNLKDPSIYENLGLIYWKLNQNKKAVSAWQSLLSLTPERADIKKRIDYLEQNGTQELKAQIRKTSHKQNGKTKNNISDNGKQSILKKALYQYRSQDYKSAIDSLKLALEHFPENTEIYTYLANCYFRNKMFDDAVKIYERLKRLDKNNTTVLENLGMLHLKQGAFKQAVAEWQKVVNKQPGRADLKQKIAKVSELIENN